MEHAPWHQAGAGVSGWCWMSGTGWRSLVLTGADCFKGSSAAERVHSSARLAQGYPTGAD